MKTLWEKENMLDKTWNHLKYVQLLPKIFTAGFFGQNTLKNVLVLVIHMNEMEELHFRFDE